MGVAVADLPNDTYTASGSFSHYTNVPAIHLMLTKDELLKRTSILYQGSGGKVASLLVSSPSGTNAQIYSAPKNKLATAVKEISTAFGLTKKELSQVCELKSPKTIYNWIDGKTAPRQSAKKRVFDLLVSARAWRNSGFVADRELLHEPIIEGQSILHLLSQPEIDKARILFAGSRLNLISPATEEHSDPFV